MAGHSRREFGVLLGTAAGALFLPAGAGAVASGCAGSFAFVPSVTGRCSFCRRAASVRFVIAGPISICSECIALCTEIIHEEEHPREPVERKKPPFTPEEFDGLTRAEIAEKIRNSGRSLGTKTAEEFEEVVDRYELSVRWRAWKPGLSAEDTVRLTTTSLTREELASLVVARGWPGTPDEPVFDRLLALLRRVYANAKPDPDRDTSPPPPPGTAKGAIYCSFCGTTQDLVSKLIAGPTVYICDDCVGRAHGLLSS